MWRWRGTAGFASSASPSRYTGSLGNGHARNRGRNGRRPSRVPRCCPKNIGSGVRTARSAGFGKPSGGGALGRPSVRRAAQLGAGTGAGIVRRLEAQFLAEGDYPASWKDRYIEYAPTVNIEAERGVRLAYLLAAIAEAEGITISNEEAVVAVGKPSTPSPYNHQKKRLRNWNQRKKTCGMLLEDKVFDYLLRHATITPADEGEGLMAGPMRSGPLDRPAQSPAWEDSDPSAEKRGPIKNLAMCSQALERADSRVTDASTAMDDLVSGKSVNTHDVMIKMEEAHLALQWTVQIRNRALEAYRDRHAVVAGGPRLTGGCVSTVGG